MLTIIGPARPVLKNVAQAAVRKNVILIRTKILETEITHLMTERNIRCHIVTGVGHLITVQLRNTEEVLQRNEGRAVLEKDLEEMIVGIRRRGGRMLLLKENYALRLRGVQNQMRKMMINL